MRLTRNSLKSRLGRTRSGSQVVPAHMRRRRRRRNAQSPPSAQPPQNEADSASDDNESAQPHVEEPQPTTDKTVSCVACTEKIPPQVDLSNLLIYRTYVCTICDYKCYRAQSLVIHIRTHTGEKPFSCTFCDYKSSTSSALTIHKRTHTGDKPFSCPLCAYKGISSSSLIKHKKSHALRKFRCLKCDESFTTEDRLTKHTWLQHQKPGPRCSKKTFKQLLELKKCSTPT
ncbi:oocyte zinc finger protein XlCOF15 [Nilaparvata lugens]|uniref:oocyte zinc finger protein XlCOF15 n=1 Tax=Nilaparvata lugens TaxID=108931 RepID=UPI000B99BF2D|nr:oocyte zinc finger protein XlCOF15 [Nilaparvata lugens]